MSAPLEATLVNIPNSVSERAILLANQGLRQLRTGGIVMTSVKLLRQSLWDTDYIGTGPAPTIPNQIDFFTSGLYQYGPIAGTAKTEVERYMPGQQSTLANQAFVLTSIQVTSLFDVSTGVWPSVGDMQQINAGVGLALLKGSKEIWYRKLSLMPGAGLYGSLGAASGDTFPNQGPAGMMDHFEYDNPIVFYPGQPFGVRLKNSTATTFQLSLPVRIRIKLGGMIIRPQR